MSSDVADGSPAAGEGDICRRGGNWPRVSAESLRKYPINVTANATAFKYARKHLGDSFPRMPGTLGATVGFGAL